MPTLDCPRWCTVDHQRGDASRAHDRQLLDTSVQDADMVNTPVDLWVNVQSFDDLDEPAAHEPPALVFDMRCGDKSDQIVRMRLDDRQAAQLADAIRIGRSYLLTAR